MHDLLYSDDADVASQDDGPVKRRKQVWASLAAGCTALLVGYLDFRTPADINLAFLYGATILGAAWLRSRKYLRVAVIACIVLTLLGAVLGDPPRPSALWSNIWLSRITTSVLLLFAGVVLDYWIQAQHALSERGTLIRNLARTFDLAQAIVREPNGRILFWSKGAQRIYGWAADEAIGTQSHELLRTEFPVPSAEISRNLQSQSRWAGQLKQFRKSGEEVWVASHWALGTGVSDSVPVVIEVNNEITELKRSQKALAVSEQRLRRISESNVVGTILADAEKLYETNDHFRGLIGYTHEEAENLFWRDLIPPEHIERHASAFQLLRDSGSAPPFETELFTKNRARIPVLIGSVKLDGQFLSFVIDQTEQKRLQAQLARAQKLDSIGKLAGGIAHDFNNLLTVILGHVELLLGGLGDRYSTESSLQEISEAANRAADLTKQLLTFSRHQPTDIKNVALNDFIRSVEKMLHRLIKEDITMEIVLDPQIQSVRANTSQLEQVVFNLVVNARDAMPEGGRLVIETAQLFSDSEYADSHVGVTPGHYVMLTITDSGIGMPEEVKAHVFEPFFTTKDPGKGTGLGLATVYGIVTKMGGSVFVHSEPGQGTTFKLLFPAVFESAEKPFVKVEPQPLPSGNQTILVAEDESGVREYIRCVLENQGYQVLAAANGREALDIAKLHKGAIALLVTDAVMPEMGGDELATRLADVLPGTPVLKMSGYTDRMWRDSQSESLSIQKPFTPRTLLNAVRELVSRPVSAREGMSAKC